MRRRWKMAVALGAAGTAAAIAPVLWVETACRPASDGVVPVAVGPGTRPLARTWQTYPEWHIVYSADSLGRWLGVHPPSSYPYLSDVAGFWSSSCEINRRVPGANSDAKVTNYVIGVSYSVEYAVKALYENTFGRLSEAAGWPGGEDRYAAAVQRRYGAFMHETPWYRFAFGRAFSGVWRTPREGSFARHWERRFALSFEYGVKAAYGGIIDSATGATLGRDETVMRIAVPAGTDLLRAEPEARLLGRNHAGDDIYEVPRYERFSSAVSRLANAGGSISSVAGNREIMVTWRVPDSLVGRIPGERMFSLSLGDRPGWSRVATTLSVQDITGAIRSVRRAGGEFEHVYDY